MAAKEWLCDVFLAELIDFESQCNGWDAFGADACLNAIVNAMMVDARGAFVQVVDFVQVYSLERE